MYRLIDRIHQENKRHRERLHHSAHTTLTLSSWEEGGELGAGVAELIPLAERAESRDVCNVRVVVKLVRQKLPRCITWHV